MDEQTRTRHILKTLGRPTPKYFIFLLLGGAGLLWFLYAWSYQLQYGMAVTGLGDWGAGGGVPWGIYIGSFIWWVGIAHGGIIISASVRLFKLEAFKPVARMAELLTIAALSVAGLYIILHVGRPDRIVTSIIPAFPWRIHFSPLVWDVTVITLYFVMTGTYLLLTVRRDIHFLQKKLPAVFAPLYRLLLMGYHPSEDKKVERMVWWLALGIILMAPLLLHGGVIPWLFALLPSMPGWYGAIQGPQFLSIALTSALGAVLLIAYIFRRAYGWKDVLPDSAFRSLGSALALFALFFLWLQLQQIITGVFAPPLGVEESTAAKLHQPLYWAAIIPVGLVLLYLGAQWAIRSIFSITRTVVAGVVAVLAVFLEKVLFVVEGLMEPGFKLYQGVPGSYWPSWVELSSVVGAFSFVLVFFLVVAKVMPIVEVVEEEAGASDGHREMAELRLRTTPLGLRRAEK
ncbi:MAG: polysulfide reductase NrfD [Chloroflexi bacterium]|nr:polysulfide reductase NrfD [Chloroflexota bacterium]